MLAKFSRVKFERTVSQLRKSKKKKKKCCVHLVYKRTREIRKFHVIVALRRLRNVQKKRDARAKFLPCYLNLLLFYSSRSRRRRRPRRLSSLLF